MRRLLLFSFLIASGWYQPAGAVDNQTLWKEAADYYDQANYRSAIDDYSKLLERGFVNPQIYYNLGNSYFKAGQLGHSIWSFRRAVLLDPGFKQARGNLDYVRSFNTDQIASQQRGFILDIWDAVSGYLSANGYLLVFMIAWWIAAGMVIFGIIRRDSPSWLYYLLIVPAIVIIFSGASAARRINEDRLSHWGVLVTEAADIREGPGQEFNRIEVAHQGLELKILGSRENSYLIELGNGLKGWVDKNAVLEI
jgi:tetratricopeptide (TPR) repeat protein